MAIQDLGAEGLRERLRERPDSVEIVDVRQPAEFTMVHIRGSKLLPLDQLGSRWGEIDWSKDVVFVCRSGARSRLTAQAASASGRDVGNLRSGSSSATATARGNSSRAREGVGSAISEGFHARVRSSLVAPDPGLNTWRTQNFTSLTMALQARALRPQD